MNNPAIPSLQLLLLLLALGVLARLRNLYCRLGLEVGRDVLLIFRAEREFSQALV